jgi:translocation and assembly module TamA
MSSVDELRVFLMSKVLINSQKWCVYLSSFNLKLKLRFLLFFYNYLIISLLSIQCLGAQENIDSLAVRQWTLQIKVQPNESKLLNRYRYEKTANDSLGVWAIATQLLSSLQKDSYLGATFQKLDYQADTLKIQLKIGESYRWQRLKTGNVNEAILNAIDFKAKYFDNQPFRYQEIENLKQKILRYSENHGHPFATIQLDSLEIQNTDIQGVMRYDAGVAIKFDTLVIVGNAKIKPSFLARYLKIQKGQIFDQSRVDDANRLLKQLPYLSVGRAPAVNFASQRAFVNLFVDKNRANQADGILGIQPNEARRLRPGQPAQLLLTGELNLALKNLFNAGKNFRVKWQRLQVSSQLLELEFENPVLFKSNFDFKVNFNLLRQDSNFVNNEFQFTLFYNLPNSGKLNFSLNNRKSNLGDANLFVVAQELPAISEVAYFSYGLGYEWNDLDNFFNPRKGNRFNFSFRYGNKNVSKNPFLNDTLYRNIALKTNQILLRGEFAKYTPVGKRSVFLARLHAGGVFNESLFLNDLYRLGGLNTLRGHNENIFFASLYAVATAEYRFFFESESYFFFFYDQSYLQTKILKNISNDTPLGLGLGLSFATRGGIFNLVYALGKSREQDLAFNRSKIHFGVVSRF